MGKVLTLETKAMTTEDSCMNLYIKYVLQNGHNGKQPSVIGNSFIGTHSWCEVFKCYLPNKYYYVHRDGDPNRTRRVNKHVYNFMIYNTNTGKFERAHGRKEFDRQIEWKIKRKLDPSLPTWDEHRASLSEFLDHGVPNSDKSFELNQWTSWKPMVETKGKQPKRDKNFLGFEPKDKDGYHMGGIYLYAFDETGDIVNDDVDILDDRIIYNGAAGSTKHRGILHRSQDFMGSVLQGENQKRPYHNGMIFREKFGIENHVHLYSAYFPMGFGLDKQIYHDEEMRVQAMIMKHKGELPPCHGSYDSVNLRQVKDAINAGIFSDSELKEILKIIVNKL